MASHSSPSSQPEADDQLASLPQLISPEIKASLSRSPYDDTENVQYWMAGVDSGEQPDIEGEVTSSLDSTLINSRGFHDLGDLQDDLDGPFDNIHLPMIDEAWDRLAHDMSCSYNGAGTVTSATSYGDAVAQCFDITWQGPLPLAGDAIPSWSSHDPCACSQDVHQAIAQQGAILDLVYEELRQTIPSDQDYNSTWLEDVDPDPVHFYEDPCWRTLVSDTEMTAQSRREPLGDYLAFEDAIGARF